jgi:hypothetical protein
MHGGNLQLISTAVNPLFGEEHALVGNERLHSEAI